jgi:hypothetical protein
MLSLVKIAQKEAHHKVATFKNLNDLYSHIEKQIHSSLLNEVQEGVKDVMEVEIMDAVYSKYEPTYYKRRFDDGGLLDRGNMQGFVDVKTNILEVHNLTPFNDSYNTVNHGLGLVNLIEGGHGAGGYYYDYHREDAEYMEPRPFMAQTKKSIAMLKSHKADLKRGLKIRGIKVK